MRYINKGNKATKLGFGEGVLAAAQKDERVVGLGADITASVGMNLFRDAFPDRFFSMGIAEQDAVSVASGLALSGKIPVFSTYGVFAAHRANDQIRISTCYNQVHVVIGGAHAGVSVGPDGATHQALEDIAAMRVLPNMTVISPCDATQAKIATEKAILELDGPVYIRFGREPMPDFTAEDQDFQIGKAQLMREGNDITLVATGHEVWEALEAAHMLEHMGISARVINMHTIKPLDGEILNQAAEDTRLVFTIEEHQVAGGLGGAVSEFLSENHPIRVIRIGMDDCFGESGQAQALMHKFGLDAAGIVNRVLEIVANNDLSLYIRRMGLPFDTYPRKLYDSKMLYEGYDYHNEATFATCHDSLVYQHYIKQGKRGHTVRETLARALHDHFITYELYKLLDCYDEKMVIGVMGGHARRRDDPMYRQIVYLSKKLTEMGRLMVTGGGPGAMEAAHLGAYMAGRTDSEVEEALSMLVPSPTYKDEGWLCRSFEVMERFPLTSDYHSLAIPTYFYGHEPTAPFATDIAKYFDNSVREDGIVTVAKGGIIYTPGSAGTMQEIFQDAGQNHYETEGFASPMIFMGKDYYTHYMPAYSLLKDLSDRGIFKNMLLTISDDNEEIIEAIVNFYENSKRC
jgi:transketolase